MLKYNGWRWSIPERKEREKKQIYIPLVFENTSSFNLGMRWESKQALQDL